uniref:39S ribosomal protein L52, mitochondrial n=1 Tax=Caenorhabditis tropicalis TaxID=1561998 RepID=A0A1I7UNY6_9PELO
MNPLQKTQSKIKRKLWWHVDRRKRRKEEYRVGENRSFSVSKTLSILKFRIYTAPHQHVFEQSPDFSFKDGRTIHVTSRKQLDYKLDQIRLAKKMVALLKETEDVERVYKREQEARERREKEEIGRRPMAKGTKNID